MTPALIDTPTNRPDGRNGDNVKAHAMTRQCWNCEGTGRSLIWNAKPDAKTPKSADGPCCVCSGQGELAAND